MRRHATTRALAVQLLTAATLIVAARAAVGAQGSGRIEGTVTDV